jgi:hypothetical protein
MQPTILTVNNANYRVFKDENNILYPANHIDIYALRRVTSLAINTPRIINFNDLDGFWTIDSCYISSPADSEIKIEILDNSNVVIFVTNLLRNETPKTFPTVIVNNSLTMRLTASRTAINSLLIYLKPAYLAYSKDF